MDRHGTSTFAGVKSSVAVLFRRLFVFGLLYLGVRIGIEWLAPYHAGNAHYTKRISFMKGEGLRPDVIFFGSSQTYRQIAPRLFDSIVSMASGRSVTSYNLGVPAAHTLESLHLAGNLMNSSQAEGCRTIFVELSMATDVNSGMNRNKERVYYWLSPDAAWVLSKGIVTSTDLKPSEKLSQLSGLVQALLYKHLGVGRFRESLLAAYDEFMVSSVDLDRGFLSLESEYAKYGWEAVRKLRDDFDTARLSHFKDVVSGMKYTRPEPLAPVWASHFERFFRIAEHKGIRVVFVAMPPYVNGLDRSVADFLGKGRFIDLSDPEMYPDLYEPANYFDNWHFNDKGSRSLTIHLAKAFSSLTKGESSEVGGSQSK